MKTKSSNLLFILFIFTLITACKISKISAPPHYGTFIKNGSIFVELPKLKGPPEDINQNLVISESNKPVIFIYYDYDVSFESTNLQNMTTYDLVNYQIFPTKNGTYELLVENELSDGTYCLAQWSTLLPLSELPFWCFRVGNLNPIKPDSTAVVELVDPKLSVDPDGEGFFLVNEDLSTTQLPDYRGMIGIDITGFFKTNQKLPVAILKSSNIDPREVKLIRGVLQIPLARYGIYGNENNGPCSYSVYGGKTYSITSIDGIAITSCNQLREYVISRPPLSNVDIQYLSGTMRSTFTGTYQTANLGNVGYTENYPPQVILTEMKWGDSTVAIYPKQNLTPGVYCYKFESSSLSRYSCFLVIY